MAENPLKQLASHGQSVWLDFIRRELVTGGGLARLVSDDGLAGLTSNPAIFEKAMGGGNEYAGAIRALGARRLDAMALYETLAIEDIRGAADVMRGVYDTSAAGDGYVSLEVSPFLAHDTAGTIAEAHRLWAAVARPNLMIKVPATSAGLPAIEALLADGINVNVTLLFARSVYEQVAARHIAALERRAGEGKPVAHIASVASFFVSRIDSVIDALPDRNIDPLRGKVAIANAKLAYEGFTRLYSGTGWNKLAHLGAQPQRLLWASTGTKNAAYRDVLYVEELIGPQTVNTLPPATLDAFRDHGRCRASLAEDLPGARATLAALAAAGVSLDAVTGKLLEDGVKLFADAFDKLLKAVESARAAA